MNSASILKYVFLNRYRKLTYSDSGPFWFFGVIYLISLYQLFFWENEYVIYVIFAIHFLQNTTFLDRKDFTFFKKQLGFFKTIFIIKIDLLILSLPILLISLFKSFNLFLCETIVLFTLPYILVLKKGDISFIKLFSAKDPLWLTHLRKKPWIILFLFFMYYIQYEGLSIKNNGLFIVATYGILYLILNVYSENENLIYLKLSNKNLELHFFNLLLMNLKNTIFVMIPSILIALFFSANQILDISLVIIGGSIVFWQRYFFSNNQFIFNFIGLVTIVFLAGLQSSLDFIYFLIIIFFFNILLSRLTVHKIKTILNNLNE